MTKERGKGLVGMEFARLVVDNFSSAPSPRGPTLFFITLKFDRACKIRFDNLQLLSPSPPLPPHANLITNRNSVVNGSKVYARQEEKEK